MRWSDTDSHFAQKQSYIIWQVSRLTLDLSPRIAQREFLELSTTLQLLILRNIIILWTWSGNYWHIFRESDTYRSMNEKLNLAELHCVISEMPVKGMKTFTLPDYWNWSRLRLVSEILTKSNSRSTFFKKICLTLGL